MYNGILLRLEQMPFGAPRSFASRFGVALFWVVAFSSIRFLLDNALGRNSPILLYDPAVLLAACYGGFGGGVVATILSATAAAFFWMEPRFSFQVANASSLVGLVVFICSGIFISMVAESWHRALRRRLELEDKLREEKRLLEKANAMLHRRAGG
jgi:K+-sensing histidine kinase KdpD